MARAPGLSCGHPPEEMRHFHDGKRKRTTCLACKRERARELSKNNVRLKSGGSKDLLPTAPMQAWIEDRVRYYETQTSAHTSQIPPKRRVAYELGIGIKTLHRYRTGQSETKRRLPDGTVKRKKIKYKGYSRENLETMLHHAGVPIWEVYPELKQDDNEPVLETFCHHCREVTLTGEDQECLWCEGDPRKARKVADALARDKARREEWEVAA